MAEAPAARAPRWFDEVPECTALIPCGGALHRVSWRRGKVVLHDHVLRDEEVVLSLGGEPPPCVAALVAWRDRDGWERALRPQPAGFVRRQRPPEVPETLTPLRRLGVVRRWERRWRAGDDPDVVEDIYRVLRRTAVPVLTAALEHARTARRGGPVSFVEVRLARRGGEPAVDGRIDETSSRLVATLRPEWLYLAQPDDGSLLVGRGRTLTWRAVGNRSWIADVETVDAGG